MMKKSGGNGKVMCGIEGKVSINRDEHGFPVIRVDSLVDLFSRN
jgi:acyl-homoserine lactone acylase PvdQ